MNAMVDAERSVLMIGAGMLSPKKAGNPLSQLHRYLNYGLLGLAGELKGQGFSPRVFHGHFDPPEDFVARLDSLNWLDTKQPILLSIPSSYALGWARLVCRSIKERHPAAMIVAGGRWVVAEDGAWLRKQIPDVDLVVYGTAEHIIGRVLEPRRWSAIQQADRSVFPGLSSGSNALSTMDYTLLDGAYGFTPSFEVSRGCGRECGFCAESKVALSQPKPPSELASEIAQARLALGHDHFNAYFEASLFQPSTQWITQLQTEFAARDLRVQWRAETRVDNMTPRQIGLLAKVGLKVIDLGLESASPGQLAVMGKTTSPTTYLRKAAELLKACHDEGVWPKVNVLLYAGETQRTLDETREWLDKHALLIKGVSVGSLVVYRYGDESRVFLTSLAGHGTRPVSESSLDDRGFADLHLSEEMSHSQASEAARAISRTMMTARDYFDLKAFSYLPPGMAFTEFEGLLSGACMEKLPFSH